MRVTAAPKLVVSNTTRAVSTTPLTDEVVDQLRRSFRELAELDHYSVKLPLAAAAAGGSLGLIPPLAPLTAGVVGGYLGGDGLAGALGAGPSNPLAVLLQPLLASDGSALRFFAGCAGAAAGAAIAAPAAAALVPFGVSVSLFAAPFAGMATAGWMAGDRARIKQDIRNLLPDVPTAVVTPSNEEV